MLAKKLLGEDSSVDEGVVGMSRCSLRSSERAFTSGRRRRLESEAKPGLEKKRVGGGFRGR